MVSQLDHGYIEIHQDLYPGWITGEVLTVDVLEPSHISHRFPAAA